MLAQETEKQKTKQSRRIWKWRRDLNYLLIAITEILWLAPLVQTFNLGTPEDIYPRELWRSLSLVALNVIVALVLRRYLIFKKVNQDQQPLYLFGGMFIALILTLGIAPMMTGASENPDFNLIKAFTEFGDYYPRGVIFAPIIILTWTRGFAMGKNAISHISIGVQIRLGIMAFFVLATIGTQQIKDDMLLLMPIFFGTALMSAALARSATLKIDNDGETTMGVSWLGFITGIVILLVLGGFLFALVLAGLDRDRIFEVIELIAVTIVGIILLIASPILWVFQQVVTLIQQIEMGGETPPPNESGQIEPGKADDVYRINFWETLEEIVNFLGDIFTYGTIATLVTLSVVFWVIFFFIRDTDINDNDEYEAIDDRELIGGIRKAFGNQFKKLTDAFGLIKQFGVGRGLAGALTIRWVYARMEREAKKRGFARNRSQTPYEYRRFCYQAYPGGEDSVKVITDAYVAIRYGNLPENDEELNEVREALDKLLETPPPVTP